MSREKDNQPEQADQSGAEIGRQLSMAVVLFHSAIAHRVGLNATDLKTLDLLTLTGPLTAGELAEQTGLSSGTTTELIDRLEKAGFVRRERDPHDRRRVMIQPVAERGNEIDPLFFSLSQRMAQLLTRYDQHEMAAIGDFVQHTIAILTEETIQLRAETKLAKASTKERGNNLRVQAQAPPIT